MINKLYKLNLNVDENYYKKSKIFLNLTNDEKEKIFEYLEKIFYLEYLTQNCKSQKILNKIYDKQMDYYVSLLEILGILINSFFNELIILNPNLIDLYNIPYELDEFRFLN